MCPILSEHLGHGWVKFSFSQSHPYQKGEGWGCTPLSCSDQMYACIISQCILPHILLPCMPDDVVFYFFPQFWVLLLLIVLLIVAILVICKYLYLHCVP